MWQVHVFAFGSADYKLALERGWEPFTMFFHSGTLLIGLRRRAIGNDDEDRFSTGFGDAS